MCGKQETKAEPIMETPARGDSHQGMLHEVSTASRRVQARGQSVGAWAAVSESVRNRTAEPLGFHTLPLSAPDA